MIIVTQAISIIYYRYVPDI